MEEASVEGHLGHAGVRRVLAGCLNPYTDVPDGGKRCIRRVSVQPMEINSID